MGPGINDEGLSRIHIMKAVEDSLRRLQTDYIDLYQTHWVDENTPIEETLSAMTDLVHQGKVRYIGCSNIPAWRLVESLWVAEHYHLSRYDSLEPHYHLLRRAEFEAELADVCRGYNLAVMPYSPLAGGFLTGKYRRGETDTGSQRNVSKVFHRPQLGPDRPAGENRQKAITRAFHRLPWAGCFASRSLPARS